MVIIDQISYDSKKLHRLVEVARAMMDKPKSTFLHFSFIIDKSKILSIGWNTVGGSTPKIGNLKTFYPLGGQHSEHNSLRRLSDLNLARTSTLVNIRLNNRGEIRMSKPCDICMGLIKTVGFKKLFYSTNNGFEYMDLREANL